MSKGGRPGKVPPDGGDDPDDPKPRPPGGRDGDDGTTATSKGIGATIAKIVAGIAAGVVAVVVALFAVPKAAANAYWGWLPEEYRMPACSSSCCASMASFMLAIIAIFMSQMK